MTMKQWNAVIQLVGLVVVGAWLVLDGLGSGASSSDFAAVAMKLVWAIGAVIAFNILGTIVTVIVVSIVTRSELKDEKSDERDAIIDAKSMRNGGAVTSILAALSLLALAFGVAPVFAVYALFAAPVLGGATDAVSRLVYYRIG
jgi:hypothetical protein